MTVIGPFNKARQAQFKAIRRVGITFLIAVIAAFQLCGIFGLRLNGSPSLPIGLYVTSPESSTNLVEFCPAEPFASVALSRGYRDPGACSDGGAPLVKPVIARPGDLVEVSRAGIVVNDHVLPNTTPLRVDTKGRPLTSWPPGRYTVEPGFVWVASSYNARSFDSRYFGPVAISSVRNRVKPLLTLR